MFFFLYVFVAQRKILLRRVDDVIVTRKPHFGYGFLFEDAHDGVHRNQPFLIDGRSFSENSNADTISALG